MKQTILFDEHVKLGAKMVPFAGFTMPVSYSGVSLEHLAVRNQAGLFDVSHMGEFIVKGKNAGEFLNSITTNDVSKLGDGNAQYSLMTNAHGGIIDDLLVYRMDGATFMLVVNASNTEKDYRWISELLKSSSAEGVTIKDISERTALLALQGPAAAQILQKHTALNLTEIPYYSFSRGVVAGIENVVVSATGYTGSGGFELYFDHENAPALWRTLLSSGKSDGLVPAGLGARDTLRTEMGYCLYGHEIDDATNPLEAGLAWITKLSKDFTASSILKQQKVAGLKKRLIGFRMTEKGIPRPDYLIKDQEGNAVGRVTSGTFSPTLQHGIGIGYVDINFSTPRSQLLIAIRDQLHEAEVVTLPFYNKL